MVKTIKLILNKSYDEAEIQHILASFDSWKEVERYSFGKGRKTQAELDAEDAEENASNQLSLNLSEPQVQDLVFPTSVSYTEAYHALRHNTFKTWLREFWKYIQVNPLNEDKDFRKFWREFQSTAQAYVAYDRYWINKDHIHLTQYLHFDEKVYEFTVIISPDRRKLELKASVRGVAWIFMQDGKISGEE